MIHTDTTLTPEIRSRYRVLAGPFATDESTLHAGMVGYLAATGARVVTVASKYGPEIWRLRSECESLHQTERRIKKRNNR